MCQFGTFAANKLDSASFKKVINLVNHYDILTWRFLAHTVTAVALVTAVLAAPTNSKGASLVQRQQAEELEPYGAYGNVKRQESEELEPYGAYGNVKRQESEELEPYGAYGNVKRQETEESEPYGAYGNVKRQESEDSEPYGAYGNFKRQESQESEPYGAYGNVDETFCWVDTRLTQACLVPNVLCDLVYLHVSSGKPAIKCTETFSMTVG
ncbi:hypothetical protein CCM_04406 [Cordyceps militaris CM01]|uniref:Uncharacterized protein n=1 Tax=Cordyceps militaris (strain CM01) TaxID=983644 RepID=G3JES5_CORMM|nr:uncharacterized protein CCM_04406 [Cordyceps militaris CM01]EGX93034.1 hypothetical protein CCM_04406 [Cordyceps militaris CM01]